MTDKRNPENSEPLAIALRAFTQLKEDSAPKRPATGMKRRKRVETPPSAWVLVFDTETAVDEAQQLRFGTYRVYENDELREEGLFFDRDALDIGEEDALRLNAAQRGVTLRTVREFVDEVFYLIGFAFRGTIVGFNLPFDIPRLALEHTTARGWRRGTWRDNTMRGGFSFRLSNNPDFPRVQIKHLNRRAAFIRFAAVGAQRQSGAALKAEERGNEIAEVPIHRGFFIDVKTIAAAILSESFDLGRLADRLKTEHRKIAFDNHGGTVDAAAIDYALCDPLVTWECFVVLRNKYDAFQLTQAPLHAIYSEASIGKALANNFGVQALNVVQPDFPRPLMGQVLSTFYGGRAEVGLRRQVAEVVYCDFLSMYPTVCVNMGLWRYFTAKGLTWVENTSEVRAFIDNLRIDNLLRRDSWLRLATIVEVLPDYDVFPVRAAYGNSQTRTIGRNRLTSRRALFFTLADCLVSKLMTGKTPRIVRAITFEPKEPQEALRTIDLFGDPGYRIDPLTNDPFCGLIDIRNDVRAGLATATADEREIIDDKQRALKIIANSLTYGVNAELNEEELAEALDGWCYPHTGTRYAYSRNKHERPGRFFNPLLATMITSAARLMLTMAEQLGAKRGLKWGFCDTDSIAFERPDNMDRGKFHDLVDEVRAAFEPLNPYKLKGDLLKLEDADFALHDGKPDRRTREPLFCLNVSAKRYVLFNGADGLPLIRKASAHGLGHVLDPYTEAQAPTSIPKPSLSLKDIGVRRWQYDLWYCIALAALKGDPDHPDYSMLPNLNWPAIRQDTMTTPGKLKCFDVRNAGKPYSEQVKPFNFFIAFQPRPLATALAEIASAGGIESKSRPPAQLRTVSPIARYCRDPAKAAGMAFDRDTGQPVHRHQLRTYRETLARYHLHPEGKFKNGNYRDKGRTEMRHVEVKTVENIGKEANHADDQLILEFDEDSEAQAEYGQAPRSRQDAFRQIRECADAVGIAALARAARRSERQVAAIINGKSKPKATTLHALLVAAELLRRERAKSADNATSARAALAKVIDNEGLRAIAFKLKVDPSNLQKMRQGSRPIGAFVQAAVARQLKRSRPKLRVIQKPDA